MTSVFRVADVKKGLQDGCYRNVRVVTWKIPSTLIPSPEGGTEGTWLAWQALQHLRSICTYDAATVPRPFKRAYFRLFMLAPFCSIVPEHHSWDHREGRCSV